MSKRGQKRSGTDTVICGRGGEYIQKKQQQQIKPRPTAQQYKENCRQAPPSHNIEEWNKTDRGRRKSVL